MDAEERCLNHMCMQSVKPVALGGTILCILCPVDLFHPGLLLDRSWCMLVIRPPHPVFPSSTWNVPVAKTAQGWKEYLYVWWYRVRPSGVAPRCWQGSTSTAPGSLQRLWGSSSPSANRPACSWKTRLPLGRHLQHREAAGKIFCRTSRGKIYRMNSVINQSQWRSLMWTEVCLWCLFILKGTFVKYWKQLFIIRNVW